MGRLIAAIYDRLTEASEEACLRQWRADLLRDLTGHVLEVGTGTGRNIPFYPADLERLVLSEPDQHMRRKLSEKIRAQAQTRAELLDTSLDELPFAAESFDAVVATLVLCSVTHPENALKEIHRVLRPGGRFIFLEHVAAEDRPRRLKWQRRIEPFWKRIAGGCHLTRRTADAIVAAGFTVENLRRESMRKAWPLVRPTIRGTARKTSG
ncbi:MAG: class I SAM-dependent methyltransferase [Gemmatimonadota bacterium]|nr:class I SAM-dependent methyltransferase [Gemmatimonadota bacterium]